MKNTIKRILGAIAVALAPGNKLQQARRSLITDNVERYGKPPTEVFARAGGHGYITPAFFRVNNGFKRNRRVELKRARRRAALRRAN